MEEKLTADTPDRRSSTSRASHRTSDGPWVQAIEGGPKTG